MNKYFINRSKGLIWYWDSAKKTGFWRFDTRPNRSLSSGVQYDVIAHNPEFTEISKEQANKICKMWWNNQFTKVNY